MRLYITIVLFFMTLANGFSQIDKIYKVNEELIECQVKEVSVNSIKYVLPSNQQELIELPTSEIWKIVYSNGYTENYNSKAQESANENTPITGQLYQVEKETESSEENEIEKQDDDVVGNVAKTTRKDRRRQQKGGLVEPIETSGKKRNTAFELRLGANFSGNYMLGNDGWKSAEEGIGFAQGFGGEGYAEVLLIRTFGIKLSGGYEMWGVRRNSGGITNEIILTNIPVSGALKIYLSRGFYIFGEGSYNMLTSSSNVTGLENDAQSSDISNNLIGYGGGLGFNFNIASFKLNLAARYHLIDATSIEDTNQLTFPNQQMHFVGLRLGFALPIN